MYYPINKADRATGFLLPIYGTSTIKGRRLSNAFFWAINRSQDATLYHSFYSKTGRLRRRVPLRADRGVVGQLPTSIVREHEPTTTADGTTSASGHRQLPDHRHAVAGAARQPAADGTPTISRA
jgi:lipopolysaccharide assembly outer membrane protein LptD (OstA)